ncbi:hypothetical protein [Humibacter ginsenosidimutans]|nr:hypothetical protein [Humibacter ginsenosidimutans]
MTEKLSPPTRRGGALTPQTRCELELAEDLGAEQVAAITPLKAA